MYLTVPPARYLLGKQYEPKQADPMVPTTTWYAQVQRLSIPDRLL